MKLFLDSFDWSSLNPKRSFVWCRAALALAKLKVLDDSHSTSDPYTRVLNPSRRESLAAEAAEGLAHMERGFGFKHMLVLKMRQIQIDLVSS
jgi:hypothetical protein